MMDCFSFIENNNKTYRHLQKMSHDTPSKRKKVFFIPIHAEKDEHGWKEPIKTLYTEEKN